jgi:hypothetical protein
VAEQWASLTPLLRSLQGSDIPTTFEASTS